MALSDYNYVNFSEDYELDYHLRKADKQQSIANRATLRTMGGELKVRLAKNFPYAPGISCIHTDSALPAKLTSSGMSQVENISLT